ncbi:12740_t:CDS:1, partial [Racocetra fulgida]
IQQYKPVQVSNFIEDDYVTEEKTEEVIKTSQALSLQQNKRKIELQDNQENKKYKEFEEKIVNLIDNIESIKETQVNITKDAISISGK